MTAVKLSTQPPIDIDSLRLRIQAVHGATKESTHQLALTSMPLGGLGVGPCLDKGLERLTDEPGLTLQKAVEASITAFLR